jgi:2-hydroxy-6-oxo-octa-2,4-dienoate hydrolase
MARILQIYPHDMSCITDGMINVRHEASARPGAQEAFRKLIPKPNESGPTIVKGVSEGALRKIRQPTLVLHGREDRVIPLELGLRLVRNIPDSELHVFGNCGHWVQAERKDVFIRLAADFLGER